MNDRSREARCAGSPSGRGVLLRKSRSRDPHADHYGLYVLVDDNHGNRQPGAQAPYSAF